MKKFSKKVGHSVLYLMLFAVIGSLVLLSICGESASNNIMSPSAEMLRVHIISNSNTQKDMDIKYAAREAMFAYFEQNVDKIATKDAMIQFVTENEEAFTKAISVGVESQGVEYGVNIDISNEEFPIRLYGETLVANGDYDALIITLGEGKGDNWWCVAFPSFCVTKKTQDKEKVIVKSRIVELIDKVSAFFKSL